MAEEKNISFPMLLNLDAAYEKLSPINSPLIKGLGWDISGNPEQGIGTNNPTGEGSNAFVLTPERSNELIANVELPTVGYNKTIGTFESVTTQELYHFNFNSEGQHGIYLIDGNTGAWSTIIIDPYLGFTNNPRSFIADHRVTLRVVYDKNGNILEKHLIYTDGVKWQGWINVVAAQKTNGFDVSLFPYWTLLPPHFDRRELLEYATRPPMYKPEIEILPNTVDDENKINYIADKAFQFCYSFINTDGRDTTASPYSKPLIIAQTAYLYNQDKMPKKAQLTLYAGSCMTEKMVIYAREATVEDGKGSLIAPEYGDWFQVEIINKFADCGVNDVDVIGTDYWLRTGQWADYNYDTTFNTIKYIFDNSKRGAIVDQDTINRLFNEMPLRSKAQSDLGDAILECNNEYGYDNFGCSVMDTLSTQVAYKENNQCDSPLRKVTLYAYIGRAGGDNKREFISQPGYYLGTDTQIRFGGVFITSDGLSITVDSTQSDFFKLNFADHSGLVCYLKGTPFYSIGKLAFVDTGNVVTLIDGNYDLSNTDVQTGVYNIFQSGGYFVYVFDFTVPAGRYDATLGRHNVNITEDFRSQSTYIEGIANSRNRTTLDFNGTAINVIKPDNALVTPSKEIEIDCTIGDIDVWGNGKDLFYVYCPQTENTGDNFRFVEGYLLEQQDTKIAVELFPYDLINLHEARTDDSGTFTDKNGFYFAYVKSFYANTSDIRFTCKLNCTFPVSFTSRTPIYGSGWRPDNIVYLADHAGHGADVGACNRIIQMVTVTDITGTIPYSNIAVSIVDGATVLTNSNGQAELIIHNGQSTLRTSNIYINAAGNFLITLADCGTIPLYSFTEPSCTDCTERDSIAININVNIIGGGETSLKETGKYSVVVYGGDLAGRLMFANVINDVYIPSYLERDNTLASFIQVLINNTFDLSSYPDMKWVTFGITNDISRKKYVEWVGDKMDFIDINGNVTTDVASAEFCAIYIQSLYNFNVSNNFSTLAKYQFLKGDRVRILDDGAGNLFDVNTYGNEINIQVLGTNYNQAAINAGLIPPVQNTVFNTTASQTTFDTSVTLIVRYDSRLDKLKDKVGFWIEVYSPSQISDVYQYNEVAGFYPVINGKVAIFTGYDSGGLPLYTYPAQFDIDFWDTYLINRSISIPNAGQSSFSHLFESPNVNDSFGANLASGGRKWVKNDNAKQRWYRDDTTKSDDFVKEGLINGLATFMGGDNRKDFKGYKWGGIMAVHSERNIIAFICENDWFLTDYNFHYTYANAQGVMVTNLNNGLSEPHQKVGDNFGVQEEHTGTVIVYDKAIYWFDSMNGGYIKMNYVGAVDVTLQSESENGGVQSYFNSKLSFVLRWNETHSEEDRFEIISGIDMERENIFVSFRPVRKFSSNPYSFINDLRNIQLNFQETLMYKINSHAWTRFSNFVPEYYGKLRGNNANIEMITFAAGKPYIHNNSSNLLYNNFFGVQTTPSFIVVFNKEPSSQKILQTLAHDCNNDALFVDIIYSNVKDSFSWLSLAQFKKKINIWYAAVLRDANSYPDPNKDVTFERSMLLDGKRMFGFYFVCRFILNQDNNGRYFEIKTISYTYTKTGKADG